MPSRAIGLANFTLSLAELGYEAPEAALARAEDCVRFAVTPNEQRWGAGVRAVANIALGRFHDGLLQLDTLNLEYERLGVNFNRFYWPRVRRYCYPASCRGHSRNRVGNRPIHESGRRLDLDHLARPTCRLLRPGSNNQGKTLLGLVRKNFRTLIGIKLFVFAPALPREAASSRHLSQRGVTRVLIDFQPRCIVRDEEEAGRGEKLFRKSARRG